MLITQAMVKNDGVTPEEAGARIFMSVSVYSTEANKWSVCRSAIEYIMTQNDSTLFLSSPIGFQRSYSEIQN